MTSAAVTSYLECFRRTWSDDDPIDLVRFVVLDTETTGTDPRRDRLITIGAVAVQAGTVNLADSLEVMLRIAYNGPSVTVHGITRDEAIDGLSEPNAMEAFLEYVRDGIFVGHHIGHDITALRVACDRSLGCNLQNRWIDTMTLVMSLRDAGWRPPRELDGFSLDALCLALNVAPHDRHTAGGDAFITAQIFLQLLRAARNTGWQRLGDILTSDA